MSPAPAPKPDVPRPPSARGRAFILLSFVLLFAAACALPALHLTGRREVWTGVELIAMGWMGLTLGQYGWLANPAVLIALLLAMRGRTSLAIIFSFIAAALGLHTLWLLGHEIKLGDEPFNTVRVVSLGAGYYVWMTGLLQPLAVASLLRHQRPKSRVAAWADEPPADAGT